MATDWCKNIKEVDGICLSNYFLYKYDFDRAVYIHKKYINDYKERKDKVRTKFLKIKFKKKSNENCKKKDTFEKHQTCNGSVIEQTICFAKSLVPTIISPNKDKSPVYYTVKASKIHKKKSNVLECEEQQIRQEKDMKDKATETRKRGRMRSRRESINFKGSSSNCTLDDLNHSMTCTLSERSEQNNKIEFSRGLNSIKEQNLFKESLDIVSAKNISDDTKIQVDFENESFKNNLAEAIRLPILNEIRECFSRVEKSSVFRSNFEELQNNLLCNAQKLDNIIITLACIEKKLDAHIEKTTVQQIVKPSKLEQLEADITEMDEEEELHSEMIEERDNDVVKFIYNGKSIEKIGCGEEPKLVSVGVKADLSGRIPARFCWTGTGKK